MENQTKSEILSILSILFSPLYNCALPSLGHPGTRFVLLDAAKTDAT
jgi:hypothetical protein